MKIPPWKMTLLIIAIIYILLVFYFLIRTRLPNAFQIPGIVETMESGTGAGSDCTHTEYTSTENLPLREYAIKSSFNTAYDGGDVSANTLTKRIQEGYRFIDLNVFSASGGQLFVGFSRDNAPVLTSVRLSFADAIDTIKKHAFVKPTKTNTANSSADDSTGVPTLTEKYYNYPMFVHIRVYRTPQSTEDIVSKISDLLKSPDQMYLRGEDGKPVQIDGCTSLGKLTRKLIFTMDIENLRQIYAPTNTPSIEYVEESTQKAMRSFVNLISGGHTLLSFYRYSDNSIMNRTHKLRVADPASAMKYKTNVKNMVIVYPHPTDNNANPDANKLIADHTIQFIPMRAYIKDKQLNEYNKMFESLKTPFVPLTFAYTYLNK